MAVFLVSYQSRISTQLRTNWSNPQNSAATTPNTTLEGLADDDACGEFKKRGITPDETDDRQVTTAINGIRARLMFFTGSPEWKEEWSNFQEDVKLLAESTSRDRLIPVTDSLLDPTQDTPGDIPTFDPSNFHDYIPDAPKPNTTNDS